MAVEVPQNKEISGGGKDGGRKRVSCCVREGLCQVGSKTTYRRLQASPF